MTPDSPAADVFPPAGQAQIGPFQAKGYQRCTAAFHKLTRGRKNRCTASVPALFTLGEEADRVSGVQVPETGFYGVHAGGSLATGDRRKQPVDGFCQQADTKQMLTGHKVSLAVAQAYPDQERVPGSHMIGNEEKRSVDVQLFGAQIKSGANDRA